MVDIKKREAWQAVMDEALAKLDEASRMVTVAKRMIEYVRDRGEDEVTAGG